MELIGIKEVKTFWSLVDLRGYLGCWIWEGSLEWNGLETGYGHYEGQLAHRIAYSLLKEGFSSELHIHHLCGDKLCVNPDHMRQMLKEDHSKLHVKLRRIGWNGWSLEDKLEFAHVPLVLP